MIICLMSIVNVIFTCSPELIWKWHHDETERKVYVQSLITKILTSDILRFRHNLCCVDKKKKKIEELDKRYLIPNRYIFILLGPLLINADYPVRSECSCPKDEVHCVDLYSRKSCTNKISPCSEWGNKNQRINSSYCAHYYSYRSFGRRQGIESFASPALSPSPRTS